MSDLLVLLGAYLLPIVGSEIILNGTKVQTGFGRTLVVYALVGIATFSYLMAAHGGGIVSFAVFWAGAFLNWFRVRSHVESSVLLRMVYFLREQSLTGQELLTRYESHYGVARRLDELCRAGLAESGPEGIRVTPKGRFIIKVLAWLQ